MANPQEFIPEFVGQRESERIELMLFRHWYFIALPVVQTISIILLSLIVPIWLHWTKWIFSYGLTALLYYGWLVFWICFMLYRYLNWYRNRFIITSERVVNIDQRGLFSRKVSEAELDKVQNITHSVNGVSATMFNFGTIIIQSAGVGELTLKQVANPAGVQEEITRLVKIASADKAITADELIDFIKQNRE